MSRARHNFKDYIFGLSEGVVGAEETVNIVLGAREYLAHWRGSRSSYSDDFWGKHQRRFCVS